MTTKDIENLTPEEKLKIFTSSFGIVGFAKAVITISNALKEIETTKRIEELEEIVKDYYIKSFEKSEETDSGVFGVHIVFERKKEV